MTGKELCCTAGVHSSYSTYAELYTKMSRKELLERAASDLIRDRFANGGAMVGHTVDDSLLAAALRELAIESGTRITVFDLDDCCAYSTRVTETSDGAFEVAREGTGWRYWRRLVDEGVTWIRGWHALHEPAVTALLAAGLLDRSAA